MDSGSNRSRSHTLWNRITETEISRHSPEGRPDGYVSKTTDFSKWMDPSTSEDVNAAEIQRIYFERSKKLIPVVQTRNLSKGRRTSMSPLTPLGKTSPISSTHSMAKLEAITPPAFSGIQKNDSKSSDTTKVRSKEQDRDSFFKSLLKNKPGNEEESRHPQPCFSGEAAAVSSLSAASIKEETECGICVVPPSVEEERFLRSLGWNDSDDVALLTDEEIAAFKAQYTNKFMDTDSTKKLKTGRFRTLQSSPVGHFSSFDLVADSGSEILSSDVGSF